MNDSDFANLYIERVLNEVNELTKLKLMNETRILFLEKTIAELNAKIEANEKTRMKTNKKRLSDELDNSGTF